MNGALDEVRISNIVRSAAWISTEYNNQSSPSTFYSVSSDRVPHPRRSSSTPLPPPSMRAKCCLRGEPGMR